MHRMLGECITSRHVLKYNVPEELAYGARLAGRDKRPVMLDDIVEFLARKLRAEYRENMTPRELYGVIVDEKTRRGQVLGGRLMKVFEDEKKRASRPHL